MTLFKALGLPAFAFLGLVANAGLTQPAAAQSPSVTQSEAQSMTDQTAPGAQEDPFLWLEDVDGEDAMDWVQAQNEATLATLKADPRFGTFQAEALEILSATDRIPMPSRRGGWIYNFWQDDTHVRGLWRRTRPESYRTETPDWDVLLDFDALGAEEGVSWVFKGVDCLPPDFERCLVSLSDGGLDATEVREFDIATKSFVEGGFRFPSAKQDFSWIDRDTLLAASPLSDAEQTSSGYPRLVRRVARGENLLAAPVVFEGEVGDVGVWGGILSSKDRRIPLIVRRVSFFAQETYVVSGLTTQRVPIPDDAELSGLLGDDVVVFLRSAWHHGGRVYPQGALVSFSWDRFAASGEIDGLTALFEPSERVSLHSVAVGPSRIYLTLLDTVKGKVVSLRKTWRGWRREALGLPSDGDISMVGVTPYEEGAFALYDGFLTSSSLFEVNGTQVSGPVKALPPRFDAEGLSVTQLEARSADGTLVPYFLIRPDGAEGPMPTHIYGYGGFEVSLTPFYSGVMGKLWLEKGGAYVLANIRGGGEFGPAWHQAALRENRQRAFDDFIAVAEDLAARGLAEPKGMSMEGGSNGGLLVGATLVQRPDLYNAAIIAVPLLDMLRYHKLLAGASWMEEYGDPDKAEDRAFIEAYSPYQNLDPEAEYPLTYVYTSTKDDRVHPGHARKFAARMKAQGHGVLYFERIEGGHSAGADLLQAAETQALEYVYLHRALLP